MAAALAVALASQRANAQADGGFPIDEPPSAARPAPRAPAPPVAPPPVAPSPPPAAVAPRSPSSAVPASAAVEPFVPAPDAAARAPALPANLSLPYVLPYRAGMPVPPGYHVESRGSSGLILTGALTLGAGYAFALGVGLNNGFSANRGWLAVPLIGPWPAVAGEKITCVAETVPEARKCLDRASSTATTLALIAVDGMVQTTGVLLLIAGLANRQTELVRDDLPVNVSARQRPEGGFDLGVSGRF